MSDKNLLLNNNNMVHICHQDIKQEYDVDMQVKLEYDYTDVNTISIKTEQDLYENHIIKEELVIGPEIIQDTHCNQNIHNTEENRENSLNKNRIRKSKLKEIPEKVQNNETKFSYVCDHCKKSFATKIQLESHMRDSTCTICAKHFSFQSNLIRHMKIHTETKMHKCTECAKSFTRKDYLDTHIIRHHSLIVFPLRTHKPSVCELCNKSFARKHSRDFHLKHSCTKNPNRVPINRNKWYVCDFCQNRYGYRSSLASHIQKRHMGFKKKGKINECDYCGKKYVKKHNLQCHIQWAHLKINPYICNVCGKGFKWHCMLFAHEKKMHGRKK